MIGIDGEAYLVNLGNTASWFRTTHVRPYVLESANTQSKDKDKAFRTSPQKGKDDVSPFRLEMQIPRRSARLPDKQLASVEPNSLHLILHDAALEQEILLTCTPLIGEYGFYGFTTQRT